MTKILLKIMLITLAAVTMLVSCSGKPTLQSYFLEKQDKPGFYIQSIPKSILGLKTDELSADSKKAFESINKVNVLFYPKNDNNKATFTAETRKLDAILTNEDYKILMSHSADNAKMRLLYDGSQKAIDEVIVFGSSEEMGLGVARIMGKNMEISSIVKLMNEMDMTGANTGALQKIFNAIPVNKNKS